MAFAGFVVHLDPVSGCVVAVYDGFAAVRILFFKKAPQNVVVVGDLCLIRIYFGGQVSCVIVSKAGGLSFW